MLQLPESNQDRQMESAVEAYATRRMAVIQKLYTLAERIQAHGAGDRIDWTHVGDLGYVDGQLQELLEFLTTAHDRVT